MAATRENTLCRVSDEPAHIPSTRHTWAPCGACRVLVPADIGCEHWTPTAKRGKASESRKARNARYQREARQRARQDVAAFHAMIGYRPANP